MSEPTARTECQDKYTPPEEPPGRTAPAPARESTARRAAATAGNSAHVDNSRERWQYWESLDSLQFADRFSGGDLAVLQPLQNVRARWRWIRVNKLKQPRDSVQPRFDGRITHSEDLLHLLDRPVGPQKCRHKNLVLQAQPRQFRQRKRALNRDLFLWDPDPLNHQGRPLCHAQQVLPI